MGRGTEVGREDLLTVNTDAIKSLDSIWPPDFRATLILIYL